METESWKRPDHLMCQNPNDWDKRKIFPLLSSGRSCSLDLNSALLGIISQHSDQECNEWSGACCSAARIVGAAHSGCWCWCCWVILFHLDADVVGAACWICWCSCSCSCYCCSCCKLMELVLKFVQLSLNLELQVADACCAIEILARSRGDFDAKRFKDVWERNWNV